MSADLSYQEKRDKLADRTRAHKLFANFDVADWIGQFMGRRPRRHVLDLGCGDGFLPYFSTKKDGTGLGLAIASKVVTDHRGYIRILDNEPSGTIFSIELPIKED